MSFNTGTAYSGDAQKLVNYSRRILQPRYWPELRRLALRRLKGPVVDSSKIANRALEECERRAMSVAEALAALGWGGEKQKSYAGDHASRFDKARILSQSDGAAKMGGGADVDLLYTICRTSGACRVLETGVAFGWSSLAILSAIEDREQAILVSTDMPYLGRNLDSFVGRAVPQALRKKWILLRGADREMLESGISLAQPIDLVHYDSDKSEQGRQWAYRLLYDALRPGGLLLSDDIQDNFAFFDFCRAIEQNAVVVPVAGGEKFAGIIRKPAE